MSTGYGPSRPTVVMEPREPLGLAERKAKRAEIRRDAMARAEEWALTAHRSIKCSAKENRFNGPRHADQPEGCKGGAGFCLCECHDPAA